MALNIRVRECSFEAVAPWGFSLQVTPELEPLRSFAHLLGLRLVNGGCSLHAVEVSLQLAAEQEDITEGTLELLVGK